METFETKDQYPFIIREPTESDAEEIISYSKILFASSDQVLTTPIEYTMSVDDEKKWIINFNANPRALLRIAVLNGQIVGLLFFAANTKMKNSHTGEFGVSVHPAFQGRGIGYALVETLLMWAKTNSQIEKVYLNVFATNVNAIKLYKRLGFVEEGRHLKAIRQADGTYVDILQMYLETPNDSVKPTV